MASPSGLPPKIPADGGEQLHLTPSKPPLAHKPLDIREKVHQKALQRFEQGPTQASDPSLQQYEIEPADEPAYLEEEFTPLEYVSEIQPEGLFANANIIILKDSYPSHLALPQNAIKESDFKMLMELKQQLDKLTIPKNCLFQITGNRAFQTQIVTLIKQLMLDPDGRGLLLELIRVNKSIEFISTTENTAAELVWDKHDRMVLYYNHTVASKSYVICKLKNGSKKLIKTTPLIVLFHELCHALIMHADPYKEYPPLPLEFTRFKNEDEFQAIIGMMSRQGTEVRKPLTERERKAADERMAKISKSTLREKFHSYEQREPETPVVKFENLMNISRLRAARIEAIGMIVPDDLRIQGVNVSSEVANYFTNIVMFGLTDDLREFIHLNKNTLSKARIGDNDLLTVTIERVMKNDNPEAYSSLVDCGLIPLRFLHDSRSGEVTDPLESALKARAVKIVRYLMTLDQCTPFIQRVNSKRDNILHTALSCLRDTQKGHADDLRQIVEFLLEHRVDPAQKNKSGKSPLDIALEGNMHIVVPALIRPLRTDQYLACLEQEMDSGHQEAVELLLKHVPAKEPDATHCVEKALQFAVEHGDKKTMDQLFQFAEQYKKKSGKDVFSAKSSEEKNNLLILLALNDDGGLSVRDRARAAHYLMDQGAPAQERGSGGKSFLDLCTPEVLETMIQIQAQRDE